MVSHSLQPHELQNASLPCPSPIPGACSCPLSRWCHPTNSSSVISFSSCIYKKKTAIIDNSKIMSETHSNKYKNWWWAMAPHSSTLAWKIPWTEEPGGLQSVGSLGVGHDWATSLWLFTFMHWKRKWQPTPVFLPGESQGRGSLVGCCLWGCTESDTTEATYQ